VNHKEETTMIEISRPAMRITPRQSGILNSGGPRWGWDYFTVEGPTLPRAVWLAMKKLYRQPEEHICTDMYLFTSEEAAIQAAEEAAKAAR
jgi:hypothetical protein